MVLLSDLKVTSAEIAVSNSNSEDKYSVSATFRVVDGQVKGIYSGQVSLEEGGIVANFNKNVEYDMAHHLTFKGEAVESVSMQCEIATIVYEFITTATAKAVEESAE